MMKNPDFKMIKNTAFNQLVKPEVEENEEIKSLRKTVIELAMASLYESKGIEMKADLSKPLILAMARGEIYADIFNSDIMRGFIKYYQVLSVSNQRKGRGELVNLVRNAQDVMEEPSELSVLSRVLGKN